ncbi:amidinotransferase [Weissella viridescens]|uniref:Amidinotransferase n=1 Tax=Weissella viridescens TaxID=1629 RepID=A0A3P2RD10_WEIVI|nr:arginine deiminase family protein [Weissella viridescens]RRG17666.1 amidinotransferase [Weissella viridescens]
MSDTINVISEFAPLKKVVLAQSEFAFSSKAVYDELDNGEYDFLDEKYADIEVGHYSEDFATAYPKLNQQWLTEKQNLINIFQQHQIDVIRPRRLTETEKAHGITSGDGYSNFFVRDPFFTIGSAVIKGNLRLPHRKHEIDTINDYLESATQVAHTPYLSVTQGYLEGGDVLVLGHDVLVGYSGLASDLTGIQWLSETLGSDYHVIPVKLHPHILHLDCALSLLRPGLMIVCPEAFLDGIPDILKNWEHIEVTLSQATQLMCNGLPLDDHTYITDSAFTDLIPRIEDHGIQVTALDYQISRMFGGSFRCTTQPLQRF